MAVGSTANGSSAAKANAPSLRAPAPAVELTEEIVKQGGGKPDITHHHAQLDAIKVHIDQTTAELDAMKASLSGSVPSNTPEGKRRTELLAELDTIRQSQAGTKGTRGKILDEVKSRQDSLSAKVKALQASKSKSTYKSPEDIDAAIARLNAQVETGQMKLVEERRALSEISNLRKSRKAVETFSQQQKAIDEEREEVDKLRSQLDDPQSRALSKRFDEIKTELDAIKAKTDKSGEGRQQLLTKRGELQTKLDELWQKRRARQASFRAENDAFQVRSRQEREKRNEKYREEKRAEDMRRRKEDEKTQREDAALPAYSKEIEDCDVLIRSFSHKSGDARSASTDDADEKKALLEGVKPLELRTVQTDDAFAGATIAKKKGEEDEDGYFAGSSAKRGKGKSKKKGRGAPLSLDAGGDDSTQQLNAGEAAPTAGKEAPLNVPLPTLTALLSLNIPPPTSASDVARVVENLQRKKAFFIGDQKRKTQENIDRVEKKLGALSTADAAEDGNKAADGDVTAASEAATTAHSVPSATT